MILKPSSLFIVELSGERDQGSIAPSNVQVPSCWSATACGCASTWSCSTRCGI